MKVAKLYSFSDIRIEDIPVPQIGSYDALIKTKACGICSGDVMPWYIEKKAPVVLGHEPVGEIVELGSALYHYNTPFSVGDKVFVHHHAPCLNCKYCNRGDYVQCNTWQNTKIIPGGISEYILIPETNLKNDTLKLPETMSYEDGTLIEPTACVVKSLKRASIKEGDTILIIGLGVMGQMHVLLAREFGAKKIIGADMIQFRLNKALEFGADHVIDISKENFIDRLKDLTNNFMADIVIVGPNSASAMQQGIKAVASGGTVVFFTPARPDEMLTIDPNYIYFRDINIVTSYSCGPDDTKKALRFISKGIVTAGKLVTHRFAIEETEKAYRLTAKAKDSLKCIIEFGDRQ
ncbi:sorbitol dehydrogenase [Dissulfurispira thermophila]|uniref:Sorbitol dehydrogenase n=1 Tax=Dissulfurispira thermophila TaxID=2715679 RepID=A0A7G1H1B5_9BACT|nr:alcohol dehydrogenase catalytic domain-containing protein [Dissulfurispira thermophila]BCB95891.1 sorbitol dehydrogenase [Dissulfurispira thermophila]